MPAVFDRETLPDGTTVFRSERCSHTSTLDLFIDMAGVEGVISRVREGWTEWLRLHQSGLTQVHMLTGSRFVTTTVSVSKELSRTGEMIQIHSERERFEQAIARVVSSRARPA